MTQAGSPRRRSPEQEARRQAADLLLLEAQARSIAIDIERVSNALSILEQCVRNARTQKIPYVPTRAQYKKARTVFRIVLEEGLADRLPDLHSALTQWLLRPGESGIEFVFIDTGHGQKRAIALIHE